ncbi:hypothetical protein F511_36218 [Dorcoceras hygrometricum]|uniref:Uncharacterized protein n=1 Tax=Dorcoceras hygrometricum TaxID=472368 RepID=A0A2Z7B8L0_9LAMI|nr:hypothetical protein F511_36218 [Dorcoceras hygrometricum]
MEPLTNTQSHFNLSFSFDSSCRDVEMTTFESMGYTSLKDLMTLSPPFSVSPTGSWKDSWREIPIKDPLLQHAAWAYLQPMAEARVGDVGRAFFLKRLTKSCRGLLGCIAGVFLVLIGGWFRERSTPDCAGDRFDIDRDLPANK